MHVGEVEFGWAAAAAVTAAVDPGAAGAELAAVAEESGFVGWAADGVAVCADAVAARRVSNIRPTDARFIII